MLVMYTYNGFTLLQFLLDYFNYSSTWLLRNLPFVVQSLGMQIMIVVLLLFLKMNIMSHTVLWKPSYANIETNKERYFDPQTDVFVRCFTVNSYICAFLFYILCNILASGMRNIAVRNALVVLCISVSTIQIILCSHILYQYYNIDTNNISFDTTRTWIVQYNIMFSIFMLMISVYTLTNSSTNVNDKNYFNSCFNLTIIHLCFIFLLYFQYKFRGSPFFNRDVIFIKIILYVSYFLPFACLCLGECYVFFEKPFPIELKITSAVVFLIVFYYVILLIQLNSGISYYSMSFDYNTLELYCQDISSEILLSVVVLVIALHIIVFR